MRWKKKVVGLRIGRICSVLCEYRVELNFHNSLLHETNKWFYTLYQRRISLSIHCSNNVKLECKYRLMLTFNYTMKLMTDNTVLYIMKKRPRYSRAEMEPGVTDVLTPLSPDSTRPELLTCIDTSFHLCSRVWPLYASRLNDFSFGHWFWSYSYNHALTSESE